MVGGNPKHWAYGFTYWNNPGSFAEHHTTGNLGRFEGFLACLWSASFCVVGPEYISIVAAEAQRPRHYIKKAFKTVYWRFGFFFIGGALCVGIVLPYDDPTLQALLGGGDASSSPYVIAMKNLGISGLPHLVNALILTSIFSAGNTYTYAATRSLYGLALEGRAPKIFTKTTRNGVPIASFIAVMCFPFLSFLQVSNGSATVLTWLVNLITAGGIINYIIMTTTYIFFYKACKAQNVDRRAFPYRGWFQPYGAYFALAFETLVLIFYGYSSFTPWSVDNFFTYYTMAFVAIILFIFWKALKRTSFIKPHEADLVYQRPVIDAYEASFIHPPVPFWTELFRFFRLKKKSQVDETHQEMIHT